MLYELLFMIVCSLGYGHYWPVLVCVAYEIAMYPLGMRMLKEDKK